MDGSTTTKKRKQKRQKRPNNSNSSDQQPKQSSPKISPIEKQEIHQRKLDLSQQLRALSSQKRLTECLQLYSSPSHDELRDAHHGSIVVDCCARCGDVIEAEGVVIGMLEGAARQQQESNAYFWNDSSSGNHYKRVPIQAWTALLKAYVHSGEISKADSLFEYLMTSSSASSGGSGKKRKQNDDKHNNRNSPNVRTFNTLLRGCMWTAASITDDRGDEEGRKDASGKNVDHKKKADKKNKQQHQQPPSSTAPILVGGVPTAQRAWSLCSSSSSGGEKKNMIQFDTSSY
eukprot:scaffold16664_cov91-Skeletonema_dohrnii-CCMP3373.AAC.1